MPRYHYDLSGDGGLDADGTHVANAAAARSAAVGIALDAAIDRPPIDGRLPSVVSVRDETGKLIYKVWVQVHEEKFT